MFALTLAKHGGLRATTMDQLAEAPPALGRLDRPIVGRTNMGGEIDYEIEWVRDVNLSERRAPTRRRPKPRCRKLNTLQASCTRLCRDESRHHGGVGFSRFSPPLPTRSDSSRRSRATKAPRRIMQVLLKHAPQTGAAAGELLALTVYVAPFCPHEISRLAS